MSNRFTVPNWTELNLNCPRFPTVLYLISLPRSCPQFTYVLGPCFRFHVTHTCCQLFHFFVTRCCHVSWHSSHCTHVVFTFFGCGRGRSHVVEFRSHFFLALHCVVLTFFGCGRGRKHVAVVRMLTHSTGADDIRTRKIRILHASQLAQRMSQSAIFVTFTSLHAALPALTMSPSFDLWISGIPVFPVVSLLRCGI